MSGVGCGTAASARRASASSGGPFLPSIPIIDRSRIAPRFVSRRTCRSGAGPGIGQAWQPGVLAEATGEVARRRTRP